MFFRWWTRRKRRKLLAAPFPDAWRAVLRENVAAYARLTACEQKRIDDYLLVFIAEKNWEGCNGLAITPEIQVTVGAGVGLLTLGFDGEYFDQVQSILVYPEAYVGREQTPVTPWVVLEGQSAREGEAWHRGPVVLSWPDVLADARHDSDGHNLVLHEFAHQLDMLNGGTADGIPPMASVDQYQRFTAAVERQFQQLRRACEEERHTLLGHYAAKNKAEFFAVATEVFFELPQELRHAHSELYDLFREIYKQDPAGRM